MGSRAAKRYPAAFSAELTNYPPPPSALRCTAAAPQAMTIVNKISIASEKANTRPTRVRRRSTIRSAY